MTGTQPTLQDKALTEPDSMPWVYEVTATVQIQLTGCESDRRDGDEGAIIRAAIEAFEVDPPAYHECTVNGWWPA